MRLTEKQIKILEALARFKFLTSQQLQLIFTLQSCSYINTAIRKMNTWKTSLINSIDFGIAPWKGRLARVHFLTLSGVRFLTKELGYSEGSIFYPKNRNSFFQRDYFHRIASINFNIKFQQWLANNGHGLNFFNLYFNKSKAYNYRRSITAVAIWKQRIEPDWIGLFLAFNNRHLFIFELHNWKDTKRAIRQIVNHSFCLASGTFSDVYNIKKSAKIYYVFENESCKRSVMREFVNHSWLTKFQDYFLFKSKQELADDFYTNWHTPNGEQVNFVNKTN